MLEQQSHRRVVKTHLAVDALVFSAMASYIYVGRDGRDVAWSLFNHFRKLNADWYTRMSTLRGEFGPLLAGPPQDFRTFFHEWLDRDGFPMWPFWENVRSWWEVSKLPNVTLVHHSELKRDLRGCARRLAAFLEISVDDDALSTLERHASFEYMKSRATSLVPGVPGRSAYEGGAQAFFNAGQNGRWRDILTKEDIEKYEAVEARELPTDCARWLRGQDAAR
jgi:aryl sulfotransferase